MYAKLIDGNLEFAPQNKGAVINYNVNVELMVKDGYKEFFPIPRPEQTNRKYHIEYVEGKDSIEEIIVFDETQEQANEREAKAEEDRINALTMTPLDFIKVLENLGITYSEIQEYLASHQELDKQLKYCQNVYCGVVKQLLPITVGNVKITTELIERAFKAKYGEE